MQPWHLWTIAGIVLIILEMTSPAFFFGSFGVAACLTAVASAFELKLSAQLGVFAATSVICMFAVRPLFTGWIYKKSDTRTVNANAMIGLGGVVVDEVEDGDGPGRVRIGSEEWRAVSADGERIPAGTRVQITAVSSATVTVRPRA